MSPSSDEESTDEEFDEEEIERNFDSEATLIVQKETLPKKLSERYLLVYETYKNWKNEHQKSLSNYEENNMIVYFTELKAKVKPNTLWSVFSMLKNTMSTRENIDLSKFSNLKKLLKNLNKDYIPKKSATLTWDQVQKFMNEASDYIYLAIKVISYSNIHLFYEKYLYLFLIYDSLNFL